MSKIFKFSVLFGFLFICNAAVAQNTNDSTQLYLVTKTDGTSFYGYIVEDDGRELLIDTKTIGMLYINKSDIKQIKPVDESEIKVETVGTYKELRDEGPFTTR